MAEVMPLECEDPGAGARLDAAARGLLAKQVRSWRRAAPGAVLITVRGDAWDHAPELRRPESDPSDLTRERVVLGYQSLAADVFGLDCPVVVALDGRVSGFGLALALAADVRLATARTTLAVGANDPVAALLGGVGWLVSRIAGAGTFAQLAWNGVLLTAGEAAGRGLLNEVDDRPGRAADVAARLAAEPAGSSALKRALTSRARREFGSVLDYESWLVEVAAGVSSDGAAAQAG